MGRRAATALGIVIIVIPVLALAGYRHWLRTRTFHPLEMSISLTRGHIRTPNFYINLAGRYYADVKVDYAATYTPGCQQQAWESLQTHTIAYKNGVRLGDVDSRAWIGVLSVENKGYYSLDIEVLSDAACLNGAHPRLEVWNASEFPYDDVYQFGTWLALTSVIAGLGLLSHSVLGSAHRNRETFSIANLEGTTVNYWFPA